MNLDYYLKNLKSKSKIYRESVSQLLKELNSPVAEHQQISKKFIAKSRNLIGKSVWSTRSFYNLIYSLNPYYNQQVKDEFSIEQIEILDHLVNKTLPENKYTISDLFEVIYIDQCISHKNPKYKSKLIFPEKKITIVLIDGFLNELYQTPSFKRSLLHLNKKFGLNFFIPKMNGLETSEKNKDHLYQELLKVKDKFPDDKIWCFAFSKGGVDALFCALEYPDFFNKNIFAMSTISSPLQGTQITDHFVVKKLDLLFKFIHDGKFSRIAEELNAHNLDNWFTKNTDDFPKNIFYSSLGFESPINKAHVFMRILKLVINSKNRNDGIIEEARAHFPHFFPALNLGTISAHHLVGLYSSSFDQEALIKSHLILFSYLKKF